MATLVLTAAATAATSGIATGAAGAVAGSLVTAGAGFIGRKVDNAVFGPARLPEAVGLRLADLSVQTSVYGKMIPIVYGNARIAGNIIWSRPIKETATTTTATAGGKGVGAGTVSQSQTTFSYSVTLAIAICEGEIDDVARVWADSLELDLSQGTFRLYKGDEAQLPDSLIESFEGTGKTPAYRGIAYAVIEDFPLEAFGNRIPNFTFEVKRTVTHPDDEGDILENMITGVNIIPGSGEFVYDTIVQTKVEVEDIGGGSFIQKGPKLRINQNNRSNKADSLVALDQLLETLPNLEWVGLVVTWFGDNLDAGSCTIKPGVEFKTGSTTEPDLWSVGSFDRDSAVQILLDANNRPIYGGTPNDAGVLRYLDELKSRGLKVMFYPMFFMNIADKPWRGRVTGSTTDVSNFFTKTNGYNAFVNHYASLVAGKVDAFVIGSELIGLTKVFSGTTSRTYPAVDALVSLAATVKTTLGAGVKVTYAADWSEYHHTDDGWYNMDPLWASSNIDLVGIDAYFPLLDEPQNGYDPQKIIDGWASGEGYDFIYTDPERTIKQNLQPQFAWKNIEWWWKNTHTNPDTNQTAWVPESKKIWFTEYGFPSVDGAANQPNVFYDPSSIESFFPYFSKGRVDFRAQRQGLTGTEKKWNGSNMIEQMLIWTWDARPFPFWPDLTEVWTDGPLWKTGHWISGKLGLATLAAIVADISRKADLQDTDFDVSRLFDLVDGYIIIDQISGRSAIETLQAGYFFDAVESDGLIKYVPRGSAVAKSVSEDKLMIQSGESPRQVLVTSREQEQVLPETVNINYINRTVDYQPGNQHSRREVSDSREILTMSLPIVMADQQAKIIADRTLFTAWVERSQFSFSLPVEYAALEPTDVVEITTGGIVHKIRIIRSGFGKPGVIEISGVAEDTSINDFYNPAGELPPQINPIKDPGDTRLDILDLPALPTDNPGQAYIRFAGAGEEAAWKGAQIFRSDDGGGSYDFVAGISTGAVIGNGVNALSDASPNVFDRANKLTVTLLDGQLETASDLGFLNGANTALVGGEVIQFKNATLLEPNKYELDFLMRGRLGTEDETGFHQAGEKFILIDPKIVRTPNALSLIGLLRKYKGVSVGKTLSSADEIDFIFTALGLKPYSPVHITGERDGSNNLTIDWVRRTRIGGDLRDFADVPLNEERELYEVDIMNGSNVVRTIKNLTSPTAAYSAADQTTDFGSPQSSINVRIYQISAVVGRGKTGVASV